MTIDFEAFRWCPVCHTQHHPDNTTCDGLRGGTTDTLVASVRDRRRALPIVMQTTITDEHVTYTVCDGEREVWRAVVAFGRTDRTVAHGGAFVEAAREQERQAQRLVDAEQVRRLTGGVA